MCEAVSSEYGASMTSIGPLLPDTYAFGWVLALVVPVIVAAVVLLILYLVIRRAVAGGIRDARKQELRAGPRTEN